MPCPKNRRKMWKRSEGRGTHRRTEGIKLHFTILHCIVYQARRAYHARLLLYLRLLIPPFLALVLRRLQLPSISCILFDVLLFSNGLLGNHDRNIALCGIIYRGAMGAMVFWVCRKWSSKESWGWFVLRVYPSVEDFEEPAHDLELLL